MEHIIKGEIPFVRILIPLIAGISAAYLYVPSSVFLNAVCGFTTLMFLLLTYLIFFYRKHFSYHNRWLTGLIFYGIIFSGAYILTTWESQKVDRNHFSKVQCEALVVCIQSEPISSGGIIRFEAEVRQGLNKDHFYPLTGDLLIALKADKEHVYKYGDLLLIPAEYTVVAGPQNPGEFSYKDYLAIHGIYHQTFVSQDQLRLLKHEQGNVLVSYAFRLRQKLVLKFGKYITDKDAFSVASTLILGYRSDLSKEVLNAYSKTGTMHVLSVSGMHVGIVFIVMVFMLQFMEQNKQLRLIRAILMILLIWFYAIITGFSPAVCRSAMMISFVIIGKAIHRNLNTYNLLAISSVLLLIWDPFFLFDVGFQLSYLSIVGLVFLYPKVYHLIYIENWLIDKAWSYIALSTAAQLATFPLSMYYFHQFPVYFLISNIFIILPVAFIMYAGLLFLFVPWDVILKPLGWLLNESILFTNRGLFYIENLPFANIEGIWISVWTYLMIYAFILSGVFALIFRSKLLVYFSLLLFFMLMLGGSLNKASENENKQIVFYSLKKNTGIGFFEGTKVFIITDLEEGDKTYTYAIKPSVGFNAVQETVLISPGAKFSAENFFYDKNFIQFRDRKILIWNKDFNKKTFGRRIAVDILVLNSNPQITLQSLQHFVDFKVLLIDASNMDYRIKEWQRQTKADGAKCYVLKGNPAYVIKL